MKPLSAISPPARPHMPAIQPAETATPASWHSNRVARYTGMWWPAARFAACAQVDDGGRDEVDESLRTYR
jgi:hypothetical protein